MYHVQFIGMNALEREQFLLESGQYDFYNLFLVTKGSFSFNGETVLPGDVAIFAPHTPFERHVLTPVCFLSIHISTPDPLPCGILHFRDRARVLSTAALMESAASSPTARDTLSHLLTDLFLQYFIESHSQEEATPRSAIVAKAKEVLDAEHTCDIAALSHHLGVSHSYLIRLFRRELGQTPQGYLISKRIALARALLCDTTLTIREIAERCGFDNVYYFGNTFKKHTTLSPGKFREIYRT